MKWRWPMEGKRRKDWHWLEQTAAGETNLEKLVDAFEEMRRTPQAGGMLLYETGTFSFSGEPLFYVSLVRQFPNGEEEFRQIHMDVLYSPSEENRAFSQALWSEETEGDFFSHVRSSEAFACAKKDRIRKVSVYMDET